MVSVLPHGVSVLGQVPGIYSISLILISAVFIPCLQMKLRPGEVKWHAPGSRPGQALNPGMSSFKVPTFLVIQKLFPAMRGRKILDIFTVFPPLKCFHFNAILFLLCELFKVLTHAPTLFLHSVFLLLTLKAEVLGQGEGPA